MLCPMKAKGKLYAHFSADGCIESFLDFAKSRNTLEGGGWELTGELEDADAVLVNSCVVGEIVERNCIEDMRQVKGRMKPAARLIVTGCMLFVHVYLAAFHPVMGPRKSGAWSSMLRGKVSAEYAKSHHGKWYDEEFGGK